MHSHNFAKRDEYKNVFQDCGAFKNQTMQELEDNAIHKSTETTKNVNSCLKIAENIREDATKTLVLLHKQGEHITKTHIVAADIEIDGSRLENAKQNDALSDLSNLLEELKNLAINMGSEIDRQNKALDPFMDDVAELNFRIRRANQRGRHLLGK